MVYKSGQIFLPFCHNSRARVTDGETGRQTEFSSLDRVCIPCSAVKTLQFTAPFKDDIRQLADLKQQISQEYYFAAQ